MKFVTISYNEKRGRKDEKNFDLHEQAESSQQRDFTRRNEDLSFNACHITFAYIHTGKYSTHEYHAHRLRQGLPAFNAYGALHYHRGRAAY